MTREKAMRRIAEAFRDDKRHVVIVMSDGSSLRGLMIDNRATSEPIGVAGEMVPGPVSVQLTIEVMP